MDEKQKIQGNIRKLSTAENVGIIFGNWPILVKVADKNMILVEKFYKIDD